MTAPATTDSQSKPARQARTSRMKKYGHRLSADTVVMARLGGLQLGLTLPLYLVGGRLALEGQPEQCFGNFGRDATLALIYEQADIEPRRGRPISSEAHNHRMAHTLAQAVRAAARMNQVEYSLLASGSVFALRPGKVTGAATHLSALGYVGTWPASVKAATIRAAILEHLRNVA